MEDTLTPAPSSLVAAANDPQDARGNPPSAGPLSLIQQAIAQKVDIDQLRELMALEREWKADKAREAYDAAFAAFKAETVAIVKNRQVTDGPLKNKRYAELFAVVNAATPMLSKHGLSSSWKVTKDEKDWLEVTCVLRHVAGHSESVSLGGPPDVGGAKNPIQARASTVTYLERYTLKAILGLSEQDEDTDGRPPEGTFTPPPDDLVADGQKAADKGMKAFSAWFNSLSPADAAALGTNARQTLATFAREVDKQAGR